MSLLESDGETKALMGHFWMPSGEDLIEVLPENADPEMRWMMDYWMSKRKQGSIPLRADIDPLEFYKLWPTIYLTEGQNLEDLYVKVAGSAYRGIYGYEVTGQRIIDLIPEQVAPHVIEDYAVCFDEKIPVYREGNMTWRERNAPILYSRLLMPLGNSAQAVTHILGFALIFTVTERKKIVF